MPPAESRDDHLAGFCERFLSMRGENRQHAAQECVLGGAHPIDSVDVRNGGRALSPASSEWRAAERDAVVRNRHDSEATAAASIRQLNCYDFSNYVL
jgi:hypothetical protein